MKGFTEGPTLPIIAAAVLACVLLAPSTFAYESHVYGITESGDVIGVLGITDSPDLGKEATLTCVSDGSVEVTDGDQITDLDGLISVCENRVEAMRHEEVLDDGAPFLNGACGSLVECAQLCTLQGAWRGGSNSASLVDDLQSTATGKACECKFGNGSTSHTLCLNNNPRPR